MQLLLSFNHGCLSNKHKYQTWPIISVTEIFTGFGWFFIRRILIRPKGSHDPESDVVDQLSMYLGVADASTLTPGLARYTHFSFTLVNQLDSSKSKIKRTQGISLLFMFSVFLSFIIFCFGFLNLCNYVIKQYSLDLCFYLINYLVMGFAFLTMAFVFLDIFLSQALRKSSKKKGGSGATNHSCLFASFMTAVQVIW